MARCPSHQGKGGARERHLSLYLISPLIRRDKKIEAKAVAERLEKSVPTVEAMNISPVRESQLVFVSTPSSVRLSHLGERESSLATYIYHKCIDTLGKIEGKYSCEELIYTFTVENWWWIMNRKSPKNTNGTTDHWFCQLNYRWHKNFINSDSFHDPHKQLEYCLEVRVDARNKWTMPRYGHRMYDHRYTTKQQHNRVRARSFIIFI